MAERRSRRHRSVLRSAVRRFGESLERASIEDEPVEPPLPVDVLEMLRRLGGAMCDCGDATDYIAEHLEAIAVAYRATGVSFFVLPTGVFVRIDVEESNPRADFAPAGGQELRLDQVGAVYDLVHLAENGVLQPQEVIDRLDAVLASEPRYGWVLRTLGLVALTVGLGMMLNPSAQALPAYVVLALLVAAVQALARRVGALAVALPVFTALVVTFVSYEFAAEWFDTTATNLLVPPLVTFLPGAALTIGTVELSTGSMISGAGRLMYGVERLLLLAFGIYAGAAVAGSEVGAVFTEVSNLGWWAPWVGVFVFGVGHYVHSPAPKGSLGWLLLTLLVAYAAQVVGSEWWGPVAAGFVGALVVPPVALWVETRRGGPPGIVTFLPAFWMLVPGALGLAGLTEIVGADGSTGITDIVDTGLTVVAIALGVLVGTSLTSSPRHRASRSA